MGLHTTFLGRITIAPPLSAEDVERVRCMSAHFVDRDDAGPGAPAGWSPWTACDRGCCLHWDAAEKPNAAQQWLEFVIGLVPRRHTFNGVLVGERQEHREVFALVVEDGRVRREVLMTGVSDSEAWGDLPLDRQRRERAEELERRRVRYAAAVARDLARREDEAHDSPAA